MRHETASLATVNDLNRVLGNVRDYAICGMY
jgi:hypothetical protein